MIWAFFALIHTLCYGFNNQLNRYWQLPGMRLVRWRMLVPALFMAPLICFIPPPTDPVYYLATLTSAFMVLIHDSRMYDVSAKYGAQVAFRLRPLALPVVFFLWLALHPDDLRHFLHAPLLAGGLVCCIALILYFLMRMTKCTVSRSAFRDMIPVILTAILFELTNKTAMDHASFPQNTLYYVFIVSGLPVVLLAISARNKPLFLLEMSSIAKQGFIIGFTTIFSMISRNIAMMHTPNPAYVTAVILTAPFWIMLLMKARGEKEEADWVSGSGLVLSVLAMVVLATFVSR